jgi:hypothetical protein
MAPALEESAKVRVAAAIQLTDAELDQFASVLALPNDP